MATGTINLSVSSKILSVTLSATNNFEVVQSNVREIDNHAIVGAVILKCKANWNSNATIFSLGTTIPSYTFLLSSVRTGQWDAAVTRMTMFYFNANGNINSNTSYSAGEYITVEFNVGL